MCKGEDIQISIIMSPQVMVIIQCTNCTIVDSNDKYICVLETYHEK